MTSALVLAILLVLSWPSRVLGDILELKSGQKLEGQYTGGSKDEVRFQVGSQTLKFRLAEVSRITIGTSGQGDFLKAAKEALRELKGLASAVEGGIAYRDYAPRVTDAKIKVDQFLDENRNSPSPLFNKLIDQTLGFYAAASNAWNARLSRSEGAEKQMEMTSLAMNVYVQKCGALQEMVVRGRSKPDYNKFGFPQPVADGFIIALDGLQPLWECARNSLINAEKALGR